MTLQTKDRKYIETLARNLHSGYVKDTSGALGDWTSLDEDARKIWRTMARRAIRKIEALDAAAAD